MRKRTAPATETPAAELARLRGEVETLQARLARARRANLRLEALCREQARVMLSCDISIADADRSPVAEIPF